MGRVGSKGIKEGKKGGYRKKRKEKRKKEKWMEEGSRQRRRRWMEMQTWEAPVCVIIKRRQGFCPVLSMGL